MIMQTYGQHIRTEEDGSRELYPFDYLEFYASNIHPYDEIKLGEKSKRIHEGITASEFHRTHKEGFLNVATEVLQNKRLARLQEELEAEGKQVCMFNLYILSMFLVERGKARYVFLLKPTIQETLSALGEVSKITFTHKDGTTVESTSETLIKEVRNALEASKGRDAHTYQVEKVVTWDKVANNSVMQNWQLMNTYKRINKHVTDVGEFTIDGKTLIIPLQFIPYSMWSNGKIDWTDKDLPRLEVETGCTIKF